MATAIEEFTRLPVGNPEHPPSCICRQHEMGIWAGYDPLTRRVYLPNSRLGRRTRERIEARYHLRFEQLLGTIEWQLARRDHLLREQHERESRWRAGNVTGIERLNARWLAGARAGKWPDPRREIGPERPGKPDVLDDAPTAPHPSDAAPSLTVLDVEDALALIPEALLDADWVRDLRAEPRTPEDAELVGVLDMVGRVTPIIDAADRLADDSTLTAEGVRIMRNAAIRILHARGVETHSCIGEPPTESHIYIGPTGPEARVSGVLRRSWWMSDGRLIRRGVFLTS